jgi:hypothetical protein
MLKKIRRKDEKPTRNITLKLEESYPHPHKNPTIIRT